MTPTQTSLIHSNGSTVTMSSLDLLELVNAARSEFDEKPVRHNDFVARCRDELDGEPYETFVELAKGQRPSVEALRMTADQCKLVAMRESKGVRRSVLKRLNGLEARVSAPVVDQLPIEAAARTFNALHSVGMTIGLQTNMAAISANQATFRLTGSNMLELIGHTHLVAEVQDRALTPTKLGDPYGMSAIAFNKLLAANGMQTRVAGEWMPTDAAEGYYRYEDTGKAHGDGTPIMQLKWYSRVTKAIGLQAYNTMNKEAA